MWLSFTHPQPGTWPEIQAGALSGNRTSNPLAHRPVLNPLSHTSQGPCTNIYLNNLFPNFFGTYLVVELLDYMIILCLTF